MKTVLYLAMSVNGMIAGKNDQAPWSDTIWETYVKTVEHFGNIIVGRRTYGMMRSGGDFESFIAKPLCVVMSNEQIQDKDVLTLTDPAEAIEAVRQKGFSKALIGGGSKLATSFLQAGLVDEIQLDLEPILMGKGLPMLQDLDLQVRLSLNEVKQLDEQVVHLSYSVAKGSS